MTEEKRILRFPKPRNKWAPLAPQDAGWVLTASPEVFTAMQGTLRKGTSKNGKHWERWDNRSAIFFSVKSGRLRIYSAIRDKGHRFFRDMTSSTVPPYLPYSGGDGQAVVTAFARELSALVGIDLGHPGDEPRAPYLKAQRIALPALTLNDAWLPIQGIPQALQQTTAPDMIKAALGPGRYRKDLVKALGRAGSLEGLMLARALRTLVPVDWLIPLVAWEQPAPRGAWATNRHQVAKPLRELLARLPERQRRLLIADLPGAEWLEDTIRMAHRLQQNELPRLYRWRELHDALMPLNNRAMRRVNNGPIPQEGPSKKLDGLQVQNMQLVSAKDTHELVNWGDHMHHCIGSYGYQAVAGTSHLFGLYDGQSLVANLEVSPRGDVRQFYGKYNSTPPDTIRRPVVAAISREMSRK